MDVKFILDTFYNNITDKLYPDFWDNEEIKHNLLPKGYEDYVIHGIYEAKPEVYDLLANEGYAEVYHITSIISFTEDFIGIVVGHELCDVSYFVEDILMSEWDS